MANTLGISISESFLQLGLRDPQDSELKTKSYFLPKVPLPRAISDFFSDTDVEHIDRIRLHLKSPRFILKRLLGTPPAVIVTSGFEDWLDMNLPVLEPYFQAQPSRAQSPLDRDLVFGLSERVDANGQVLSEASEAELEFLSSKFEMLGVKNVAICLLHSHQNSHNLEKTKRFLSERGFRIFSSDSQSEDEKARWWSSVLSAYLQPFYDEALQQLKEILPATLADSSIEISTTDGFTSTERPFPIASLFGEVDGLKCHFEKNYGEDGQVTHFGFEDFYSFKLGSPPESHWLSQYGQVAMKTPGLHYLCQQPTAVIESNFWGIPTASGSSTVGYEPGPMCLGRGLRPTLLDLIYLTGDIKTAPILGVYFSEKSQNRIEENLIALCSDPHKELTSREIIEESLELALRKLMMELLLEGKNFFIGPLANFFKQRLKKLEPNLQIQVIESGSTLSLDTLLEVDPGDLLR